MVVDEEPELFDVAQSPSLVVAAWVAVCVVSFVITRDILVCEQL